MKKNNCIILLLAVITINTHTMDQSSSFAKASADRHTEQTGWLTYAKSTLFNGYSGFRNFLSYATTPSTGFSNLPIETQTTIIQLFAKSCADTTLKDAAQTINSLVLVNKTLNKLINNSEINLQLIKSRAKKFNVSDATVATALQTKASKRRLILQLRFKQIIKEIEEEEGNNRILPRLNALLQKGVDVDFTYRWDKESQEYLSPLMRATEDGSKFLIKYLLEHGADINQAGFNGKTALMYANDPQIIKFLTKDRPSLNINQQDNAGNTALLRILQHYFPEDKENRENNIAMVQELINAGANAEISNNDKLTPLKAAQDSGDQEMIKIIQDAIEKKNETELIQDVVEKTDAEEEEML